ncbi:NAD(P)H-dependent oxidoreductase [uncultured Pseudodesulfovibrio sp.]|uniref:NAD(P)H-dependent oxidoreductase n=1 Tax=uncultured Pseudodesulfovibrio sp. TaxID=2035858 RepID=UPI0029C87479|nr:NAD(P)H-dependent oxidoreductase [uncultured Pseudodesulfovibrio sp.]
MKILGFTCSNRAVFGDQDLLEIVSLLKEKESKEELWFYLRGLVEDKSVRPKAPSNSELGLLAAAWSALGKGVEFEAVSLKHLFARSCTEATGLLVEKMADVDAIIVSTPVYFGDRSSLVQQLVDTIGRDDRLKALAKNKIFGGIAAGAKRNGGQETTLIYLILDMMEQGVLAVGNDSTTTSQYGGTIHAGDSGSAVLDQYGMNTAMGVGARVGSLVKAFEPRLCIAGDPKILFLILQDSDSVAERHVKKMMDSLGDNASVIDCTKETIQHCKACSFCPSEYSPDEEYSCVIKSKDCMNELHERLIDNDVIIPVVYCSKDKNSVVSAYQCFMERTRYIRRSDYSLSNTLIAPLVLTELGVQESFHMRMITSLIRHHTVIHKAMVGYYQNGVLLNAEQQSYEFDDVVQQAKRVGAGRLLAGSRGGSDVIYNPVGYVLKNPDGNRIDQRKEVMRLRRERMEKAASARLSVWDK